MLKKLILIVLALTALTSVSFAGVSLIPSVGIKTWGPTTDQYGMMGYDSNGTKFRLVVLDNSATTESVGTPVYYNWGQGNDYTVTDSSATSTVLQLCIAHLRAGHQYRLVMF